MPGEGQARQPFATERYAVPTIEAKGDGPFWIVRTVNPDFNDVLAHVPFVAGKANPLPALEEPVVRELVGDFHCTTEPELTPLSNRGPVERDFQRDYALKPVAPGADMDRVGVPLRSNPAPAGKGAT